MESDPIILVAYNPGMEADRLNLIENSLQDLAARAAQIRRYL